VFAMHDYTTVIALGASNAPVTNGRRSGQTVTYGAVRASAWPRGELIPRGTYSRIAKKCGRLERCAARLS
jgi:hypothetical protein